MSIFQRPFRDKQPTSEDLNISEIQCISERHVACVLLLDTSGSMSRNDAIKKLNEGLRTFKSQTMADTTYDECTKACIDVALISFGPDVVLHQNFVPVSDMNTPSLDAGGLTPMGGALNMALDIITQQKRRYTELGTPYHRPWIFCITDGEPNDEYRDAARRLKEMEQNRKVLGYCVGVENFDYETMASIFDSQRIFRLENLNFPALFKFLSNSLAAVRNSDPAAGNTVAVDAPSDLRQIPMEY